MPTQPFPADLARELFETTALMHPNTIPTLLQVARRVLIWIEPLLYRVVCSSSHPAILRATKSKPPAFFHSAVRHLFLDGSTSDAWSFEEATAVLRLCTGVINFAVIGNFSGPTLLPILAGMKVQRLTACLELLFGDHASTDLALPAFASLTHVDIFDEILPDETKLCSSLPALPALTHLCLNNEVPPPTIQLLLATCPRLALLVVLWPKTFAREGLSWVMDEAAPVIRDVRLVAGMYTDYWADWETGARGLPNFWTAAEDFVAQKRSGAIAADQYWMD
ncbi:hypothetical protein DFH08DRAFT_885004 [Mycena albidolilacea]|uniref:Uncharacterized protein n=1 Tax=Mycena albidolilacea TaxID=1033008 RepID=A0AAD6ZJY1_9AGAR|nr:hypothetical protein DFH08DRAFT_885004 [Mycena albidolilacea]